MKLLIYIFITILLIPCFTYRFKHTEKTETQLFLDIIKLKPYIEIYEPE